MDALTFIAELVKALAWPAVVVFIVIFFKERLTALVDKLEEWKGLGMEAKFNRKLETVAAETKEIAVEELIAPTPELPVLPNVEQADDPFTTLDEQPIVNALLLYGNPSAGFSLGRSYLERILNEQFVKATGQVPGLIMPLDAVIERLEKERYITARMRRTIKELLALGNEAVHEKFKPSVESARAYVTSVQSIADLMRLRAKRF
ncbi:DUF4145 domain-containing protein [Variovorax sp. AFSI2.2]|uniref:DUF4145 domain-containing protein n=1 Tax=Variovorax sp. AFSI2.2 TaxID=3384160 RepID=UPI003EBEAFEE